MSAARRSAAAKVEVRDQASYTGEGGIHELGHSPGDLPDLTKSSLLIQKAKKRSLPLEVPPTVGPSALIELADVRVQDHLRELRLQLSYRSLRHPL